MSRFRCALWAWIAGRRYANAWVVWRTPEPDYYYVGWAPMPPYWYWSGGVAVSFWVIPPAPYGREFSSETAVQAFLRGQLG